MICPLIGKCNEQVQAEKYLNVCNNLTENAFLSCPKYRELTSGAKPPKEWQKVFSP